MKQLKFLETKRTPRYSMRKLNVGMASVLLGVTIFGINLTNHSVKAATTTEAVTNTKNSNSTSHSVQTIPQQTENTATTYANKNNAQTAATQQDSAKDVAAGTTTTSQTTSNKQNSDATTVSTDSLTTSAKAVKAARIPAITLMAKSTSTGTGRNAAGTVDQNNINTQLAKENQELANKANLTSSDNYSSNIYKGTDGKYYKIVTIYGNDYVYHAADIQASGANWRNRPKQTAADTKNNIDISK
ncbi:MAG TPA: LEA family epithelial adhesin, partial [Limosilactobacillus oris]|uniref:LEA family epithelial adhesin n=1 Tax=Limosilactobacillus oris TaxID=1632 RepID=UPI001D62665D